MKTFQDFSALYWPPNGSKCKRQFQFKLQTVQSRHETALKLSFGPWTVWKCIWRKILECFHQKP